MTGRSSCRPARLERFEETIDAACDGLVTRVGQLEAALADYRGSCSAEYRAPSADTGEVVRSLIAGLRDLGRWTGAVGGAFRQAAEDAGVSGWLLDAPFPLDDSAIAGYLADEWDDPYRGVPEGMASQLLADLGHDYDQDEPPAWVDLFGDGASLADVVGPLLESSAAGLARLPPGVTVTLRVESGMVAVLADGAVVARVTQSELSATILLPRGAAPGLATAATWTSRAGFALAFVAGAGGQWYGDAGRPVPERVARATTRGLGVAGGGLLGAQLGLACGPGAPVCSTVLGIAGAFGGAALADAMVDALPWMDTPEPGEHDLDDLTAGIAAENGDVDARIGAQADLYATDLALLATADDPALNERVLGILPDDDLLQRIVAFDDASPPDWVPTGTTTTSTSTTTVPGPQPEVPPSDASTEGGAPPPVTTTTAPVPTSAGSGDPPDPWAGDRPGGG